MRPSSKNVRLEICDKICIITIDRPPVNALSATLQIEIEECIELLSNRCDVAITILTGCGKKAFMAGADITELPKKNSHEALKMSQSTQNIYNKIDNLDCIVIAAINGLALGGGCELALACDLRIADASAKFGFPEVTLGLLPGAGGTQRLARLVGVGKAKWLIYTGDLIDANEAKDFGLIERVVPEGQALEEAKKLATHLASRGLLAMMSSKKAINDGIIDGYRKGLETEAKLFSQLFNTRDMKEGVTAFIEKRKPVFIGK